jgi:hypothetical protein
MPQPLNLVGGGSGTLLVRHQMRTLLPGCFGCVVLEVTALEVGHGLKTLLPYRFLLIPNQEKRDRQCCSSSEAVLAQGGESQVRHQLNAGVRLDADDGPRPWLCGVEGYCHADLTLVHAMGRGQSATVDRSVPVVAKTDECVV